MQKVKNKLRKKKSKRFLKTEISLKKIVLNYNSYNQKKINENLKPYEIANNKIKQYYLSNKKFKRLDSVNCYKKYINK